MTATVQATRGREAPSPRSASRWDRSLTGGQADAETREQAPHDSSRSSAAHLLHENPETTKNKQCTDERTREKIRQEMDATVVAVCASLPLFVLLVHLMEGIELAWLDASGQLRSGKLLAPRRSDDSGQPAGVGALGEQGLGHGLGLGDEEKVSEHSRQR